MRYRWCCGGQVLTQVLINLVGNAIKFTDAGGVVVKAVANNGSFQVSVRDTGPGISAADQACEVCRGACRCESLPWITST